MNEPVESVLQKSREEFEKYAVSRGLKPERWLCDPRFYVDNEVQSEWNGWQASRSAMEPILAELGKYKSAIENHLCVNDAAYWLACSCGHEHVCVLCSMDKGIIPDQPGCFHEVLKLTKERAEAAEQALREAQAELAELKEHCESEHDCQFCALSPSPTPAPDTNTQSLCHAKPSPDSPRSRI